MTDIEIGLMLTALGLLIAIGGGIWRMSSCLSGLRSDINSQNSLCNERHRNIDREVKNIREWVHDVERGK